MGIMNGCLFVGVSANSCAGEGNSVGKAGRENARDRAVRLNLGMNLCPCKRDMALSNHQRDPDNRGTFRTET